MRESGRTTSEKAESTALQSRRLLFSGACGSAGGSLAWLLWLFFHAVQRNPSTIFAPIIGACVGGAWEWMTHYLQTAKRERIRKGKVEPHHDHTPKRDVLKSAAIAVPIFTLLICEHTLGELVHEFLAPFLASIVTLFPLGQSWALAFCPQ
jgi:hypothetical protein